MHSGHCGRPVPVRLDDLRLEDQLRVVEQLPEEPARLQRLRRNRDRLGRLLGPEEANLPRTPETMLERRLQQGGKHRGMKVPILWYLWCYGGYEWANQFGFC